jgi:hypothetical protein
VLLHAARATLCAYLHITAWKFCCGLLPCCCALGEWSHLRRSRQSACALSSEGGAVLRYEKWRAPVRHSRPSPRRRAKASSGERRGFAWSGVIYALRHSPLWFTLLCTQPPLDFPLNAALLCLPCSCSFLQVAFPLQTNKQQAEFNLSKRPFLSVDLDTKAHSLSARRSELKAKRWI